MKKKTKVKQLEKPYFNTQHVTYLKKYIFMSC